MGLGRVIGEWVKRRHPAIAAWPWNEILGGGSACLVGLVILSIGALEPSDDAFPSGRGAVFVAGLVFFLTGVAILLPALARGRHASLAQAVVVASLLSAFAAVPALIVFSDPALPWLVSVLVVGALALLAWDQVLKQWIPRTALRLSLYAGLLVVAVVVARRIPALGEGPAQGEAQTPVFEPVTLELQRDSVVAGGTLRVTFDPPIAMPRGFHYWICIVPKHAPVFSQGRWAYLDPGASAIDLTAPDEPGDYEVRLRPHMNAILASRALVVRPVGTREPRPDVEER
jgi:hypothetical protein